MKYIISTLGCKVNQYETQAVEIMLKNHGHVIATELEEPDIIIVNTCAVTAESGRKSRQTVRHLKELHPNAVVAVCGCYSQLMPDVVSKIGADVIYGSGDKFKFVSDIEKAVENGVRAKNVDAPFERRLFEELPAGTFSGRTRAMLKIQDGCANFCTYCIIPYTRGRLRSLPVEEAVKQACALDDQGYRELVLTGIEIASYGLDLENNPNLADVVCSIADNTKNMRLRLGSLEPTVIDQNFCRRLADTGKVCSHFHLSLQSGSDDVLKRMNRKYDTEFFYRKVELLRKYFSGCAITADLITGFPGESEANQVETLKFLEKCEFSQVHIFPYSRRPGTPADKMDFQIDRATKNLRAKQAKEISDRTRHNYLQSNIGKIVQVLFETQDSDMWCGHSETYLLVYSRGNNLRGLVKNVKITAVIDENLVGEIV